MRLATLSFAFQVDHSSEKKMLMPDEMPSEMLQNLPYFWNTKTVCHLVLLYIFPGLLSSSRNEKNEKIYVGFHIPKKYGKF